MHTSPRRKVKFPPPVYTAIERASIVFTRLLVEYPENRRYIGWAFGECRRCRKGLYAVRAVSDNSLLLLFCRECYWFNVNNESRVWKRAEARGVPSDSPTGYSPDRPLERDLKTFFRGLRRR
jgi:hypothetical protein